MQAAGGVASCRFTIIVHHKNKAEGERTLKKLFVPVERNGRLAEVCLEYLHKGGEARVVGRLTDDEARDGTCCFANLVLLAEHVEFKPQVRAGSERSGAKD